MDLTERISNFTETMKKFNEALQVHHSNYERISAEISGAIEKLYSETKNHVLKNDELKAQKDTLAEETRKLQNQIEQLKTEQNDLETKKNSAETELSQLEPQITDLNDQLSNLNLTISSDETKLAELEQKLKDKELLRQSTENEMKSQVDAKQLELDTAKTESQEMIDKNVIWDYLKSKIDNPEIDILAVIAGSRNISSDEIKKRASSISAVLITRSISKLEADNKIVVTPDGNWDLAPPLLAELEK